MSTGTTGGALASPPRETSTAPPDRPPAPRRLVSALAVDKIGAVYVWLAIIVVFTIWAPDTFPTLDTAKQILNTNAITGLAALSILIPLSARVFDLSFAYVMTLSGVVVAKLVTHGTPLGLSIAAGLLVGVGIGLINASVVVLAKIDSFIGTLATGSLIPALISMVTNDTPGSSGALARNFAKLGQTTISGVTLPVIYMLVVALAIWYLLEHTATGRRLYATGFNPDAARLAGVPVNRLRFISLVTSGTLAGATGIVLASILGSGSPTAGTPYLLPAFAAVFRGATQLKNGRFNAWGTIIAVLLLGTGTTGLGLAKVDQWVQDVFIGVVLIAALALTGLQVRRAGAESRRGRSRTELTGSPVAEATQP